MLKPVRSTPRLLAIAPLLLALTLPLAHRLAAAETRPAQAQPAAAPDRVDRRVERLHRDLKVTPQQENLWTAVAEPMREDDAAMRAAFQKRRQGAGHLGAVEELRSYQEMEETHVKGLQKVIPAFQALYESMSPEQKKTADTVFSAWPRRGQRQATAQAQ